MAHAEAWDATYSAYLQAWVGVFALVVATWIYQRFVLLRRRTAEWNTSLVEAAVEWDRDLWKTSDPWCNDFDIMWAISHGVPQTMLPCTRRGAHPGRSFDIIWASFSGAACTLRGMYLRK